MAAPCYAQLKLSSRHSDSDIVPDSQEDAVNTAHDLKPLLASNVNVSPELASSDVIEISDSDDEDSSSDSGTSLIVIPLSSPSLSNEHQSSRTELLQGEGIRQQKDLDVIEISSDSDGDKLYKRTPARKLKNSLAQMPSYSIPSPSKVGTPRTPTTRIQNSQSPLHPFSPIGTKIQPGTPNIASRASVASTPATPSSNYKSRQRREAEKLEFARLEAYAQEWFEEVNLVVFTNKLPADTELVWNKRLSSTAGKAHYRRNRHGDVSASIALATKILVSEERIRNTLSHEMCHLACWIINDDQKEQHGRAFKAWARQVMDHYPYVVITTKHNYDIDYPFKWECTHCGKIYGRFSKSIDVERVGCGVCDGSPLVPLFPAPIKRAKTVQEREGHMAASKPRDSPKPFKVAMPENLTSNRDELEDNELQIITNKLASTRLEM